MTKILIVDDNEDILDAIELMLDSSGYEIQTMHKCQDALTNIAAFQPDLILLDVLLAGCDGRDIAKKLKSDKKTRDIPIIMISAHPSVENSIKESGANDFLSKPFDMHKLLDKVSLHTAQIV